MWAFPTSVAQVTVIGEEPDGCWIGEGEALWDVRKPTADQLEMYDVGKQASFDLSLKKAALDEDSRCGWLPGVEGEKVLMVKVSDECTQRGQVEADALRACLVRTLWRPCGSGQEECPHERRAGDRVQPASEAVG